MIPKIIHYCWLSDEPFPKLVQFCIDSWKRHLPDYEFILWNRDRFDINSCIWVKQAYEEKKYAFAADYIRLYALYNYGGIYLDSDVEVLKSFNPLLHQSYFLGTEDETDIRIEAAIMGATPHNEYIGRCLKHYENRLFINDGKMDIETLPKIMISYARNYQVITREDEFNNKSDVLQIYSKDYFSPKDIGSGVLSYQSQNTYAIHHFNGSWLPARVKINLKIKRIIGKRMTKLIQKILAHF